MSIPYPRLWSGLALLAAASMLGGCIDTGATVATGVERPAKQQAEISPRGASVAFTSIDGPPRPVTARFLHALANAAAQREITIADPKSAHYFVRGYLTAYTARDGTELEFVWDVFDRAHRRVQRIADVLAAGGSGDDPWKGIDDQSLGNVAARSADELAAFLGTTPEAIAAAAGNSSKAAAASDESGAKALSYASTE
jgi:hypothetical protein